MSRFQAIPLRQRPPTPLKVAIVVAGTHYWPLAQAVNTELPPEQQLSERAISELATDKRIPTRAQAEAISRILRKSVEILFIKVRQ